MSTDRSVLEMLDADFEELRRRVRVRIRRAVRENLGEGTGGAAFHIVEVLLNHGPLSPSDLANILEVRTSTMTAHLDRLESLGWAKREGAAPGTNRLRVAVTANGCTAFERYLEIRRAVLAGVLQPLEPARVAALARELHLLLQAQPGSHGVTRESLP